MTLFTPINKETRKHASLSIFSFHFPIIFDNQYIRPRTANTVTIILEITPNATTSTKTNKKMLIICINNNKNAKK
jgi:hypothetical protein